MAGRAVRTKTAEINPMFYIPDGVEELKYGDDLLVDANFGDDSDDDLDLNDASLAGDDTNDYTDEPETSQVLSVVSQTLRATATGTEVVDVVFNVSDVAGVSNYELRVVKI